MDAVLGAAFDDHQQRRAGGRTLLGPDAAPAAVEAFGALGAPVEVRESPWRLGAGCEALVSEWLDGWVGAAVEQRPELEATGAAYLERRRTHLGDGRLAVTVPHLDLLALPPGTEA